MELRIGIVGLGLVGSALSARLMEAGYRVSGFDIASGQLTRLKEAGGLACSSAQAVAASEHLVLLSLPTLAISKSVVEDILPTLQPGAIVVDTTTGSPEESAEISALLAARGVRYVEALIGGSSSQVRAGEAMLMCGGQEEAYRRCEQLFRTCFRDVFYLGACGTATRMKLVLNLVLGLNRAVLAEALSFAASCGLDPAAALGILKSSPAYSRVMDTKGARMVENRFEPEARLTQHLKDVRVILDLGARHGARLPLSKLHRELLEEAERAGYGASDNSAIICAYRDGGLR